jgi:hypothetical protein
MPDFAASLAPRASSNAGKARHMRKINIRIGQAAYINRGAADTVPSTLLNMPDDPKIRWIRQTLRETAWAPLSILCAVVVGERVFDAFARFPWFDVPAHFLGGIAATYLFRRAAALAPFIAGSLPGTSRDFLALACTASTAILWEFCEYVSDRFLQTSLQHGLGDTLSDLVFGLVGGAAYLALRRALSAPAISGDGLRKSR